MTLKQKIEEIKRMIAEDIFVESCPMKENSEYHLGYNDCRTDYAESKLKVLREIEKL